MQAEQSQETSTYAFLQGGGEMGERTRMYDWSKTSLGAPDQWPQSLRTTLGILLHSAFPMFLFWGEELLCFYNDAYRPSLGTDGKHPAVGKRGKEVWPEIWSFIGPLIHQVMTTGEPAWYEDQLLPIYRNGRLEDVYWTFSYSPAYGDKGQVNGVFVTCMETTKTVYTVHQLSENKQKLAFAIEAAELATWEYDPGTNQFTADARYTEWFGLSAEQATDNELSLNIIASEDRSRVVGALRSALDPASGGRFDIQYTIRPQQKRERVLRAKGKAWFTGQNQPYRLTGTLQDVTEQVLTQRQLEESAQQVRSFIDSAPFPIGIYTGREMQIRFANKAILDAWGKGNDVIGKLYSEVLPELENQEIYRQLDAVYTTGIPFHAKNRRVDLVVAGKLQPYYFNYSFTPLFDMEGKVYGVMNTAADVTDLNLAHIKIEESETRFRNLVQQAPVAIAVFTGPDLVAELANDAYLVIAGKSRSEFLGKPLFASLPETKEILEPIIRNIIKTGQPFYANEFAIVLNRFGNDEQCYFNFAYEPLKDAGVTVDGFMVVAHEVTELVMARKKIEESEAELQRRVEERTEELAAANRELQRSNTHLEEFAHAASHDLKEPIRKIHFFTDRLKNQLSSRLNSEDERMFERVEHASRRMNALIDDLLLYSHVSQKPHEKETVDLEEKLHKIVEDLELDIDEKKAVIHIGKLPVVKGYRRQLQQLFHNLITNSLKYSFAGRQPEITITADLVNGATAGLLPDRNFHRIVFSDNGIGFEQDQSEKIFQMFQRLHGKNEYEGTGVGLSIVRKVAENHGGKITAQGEPGTGATFILYLPEGCCPAFPLVGFVALFPLLCFCLTFPVGLFPLVA